MNNYSLRRILLLGLWSGVIVLIVVAMQPSKPILSASTQFTDNGDGFLNVTSTLPQRDKFSPINSIGLNDSPARFSQWQDVCVNHKIEVDGIGMRNGDSSINPQAFSIDPNEIDKLWVQLAGRHNKYKILPDRVTFTTATNASVSLTEPMTNTAQGYIYGTEIQPTSQVTVSVDHSVTSQDTPRGLILYIERNTHKPWTSLGRILNRYVFWENEGQSSHTEVITLPDPLPQATNLLITAVVIDNNDDDRPLELVATAGEAGMTFRADKPNQGDFLDIIPITLSQVTTGTSQVAVTLRSPEGVGDSLVWVGVNVSYLCDASSEADLAVSKSVNDTTPQEGSVITYTIGVVNQGPGNATGVVVSDALPVSVTLISSNTAQGTYTNGLWSIGSIDSGKGVTLTVIGKVAMGTAGRSITNSAVIFQRYQYDPFTINDEASVSITLNPAIYHVYVPVIYKAPPPPCYTETFDNNIAYPDWHDPPPPPGTIRRYIYEKYQIFSRTKQGVHWSRSRIGKFTEYTVEVKVKWANNTQYIGKEYGLIFDRSGKNDTSAKMYRFNINTTQKSYVLGRLLNGRWEYSGLPSGDSQDIKSGPYDTNILKVVRRGERIELYINDKYQDFYEDNRLNNRPARVGVNVVPIRNMRDGDARFDDFKVCSYELTISNNNINLDAHDVFPSGGITSDP